MKKKTFDKTTPRDHELERGLCHRRIYVQFALADVLKIREEETCGQLDLDECIAVAAARLNSAIINLDLPSDFNDAEAWNFLQLDLGFSDIEDGSLITRTIECSVGDFAVIDNKSTIAFQLVDEIKHRFVEVLNLNQITLQ